jgi:hypothetical protein
MVNTTPAAKLEFSTTTTMPGDGLCHSDPACVLWTLSSSIRFYFPIFYSDISNKFLNVNVDHL